MKKQKNVLSYINSEDFILDNFLVRTGEDTCEWITFRRSRGATPEWINGTLCGVTSGVRHSGTFQEFAYHAYKELTRTFEDNNADPDFPYIKSSIISLLEGSVIVRTHGVN